MVGAPASTVLKTATARCISSIVPIEMRQYCCSNGGKSRPTSTPAARQASRNGRAARLMSMNRKFACESVPLTPRSANAFTVKARTPVLRERSASMCAVLASDAIAPASVSVPSPFGIL